MSRSRLRPASVAVAGVLLCMAASAAWAKPKTKAKPAPAAADPAAAGRQHLQKASFLAGQGKCKDAIPEFTQAYDALKDPAILFNRAECERKTGDGSAAVADFRRFLDESPNAPGAVRKQVEARIAEIESSKPAAAPVTAAVTPPPAGRATTPPPQTPAASRPAPVIAPPPKPVTPPAPVTAAKAPAPSPAPVPSPATAAAAGASPSPAAPPSLAALPPTNEAAGVDDNGKPLGLMAAPAPPPPPSEEGEPLTSRWWFWTAIGVIALSGATVAYVTLRGGKTNVPDSALGNYKF